METLWKRPFRPPGPRHQSLCVTARLWRRSRSRRSRAGEIRPPTDANAMSAGPTRNIAKLTWNGGTFSPRCLSSSRRSLSARRLPACVRSRRRSNLRVSGAIPLFGSGCDSSARTWSDAASGPRAVGTGTDVPPTANDVSVVWPSLVTAAPSSRIKQARPLAEAKGASSAAAAAALRSTTTAETTNAWGADKDGETSRATGRPDGFPRPEHLARANGSSVEPRLPGVTCAPGTSLARRFTACAKSRAADFVTVGPAAPHPATPIAAQPTMSAPETNDLASSALANQIIPLRQLGEKR